MYGYKAGRHIDILREEEKAGWSSFEIRKYQIQEHSPKTLRTLRFESLSLVLSGLRIINSDRLVKFHLPLRSTYELNSIKPYSTMDVKDWHKKIKDQNDKVKIARGASRRFAPCL